jgi:phenylacetate-CoA ligase
LFRRPDGGNTLNVDWLSRLPAPPRRALYFGLQKLIGSRVGPVWREVQKWDAFTPAQLEEAVEERLGKVLAHASEKSGYYRKLGLVRDPAESAREFLRRFPVLKRSQVRAHFTELVVDDKQHEITSPASVSSRRYDWLVVKTGGTTGEPTTVVHDATTRDWGRATRLYSARQCGFPLGIRYFRLWGSEPGLFQQQNPFQQRVLQNLLGEIPMNAFLAREKDLARHAELMLANPGIHHLMTYVDASASLAMFIQEKNLPRPRLQTIMACAGTVTPEWRQLLSETFQAEVFDKYGSRECCDLACECRFHNGLHVYSQNAFLEVVDDSGQACAPGQVGRLLVTILNNFSFPMIRYEIGDMATPAEPGPCPCGLPYPRIKSIEGRQDEMLTTADGTLLSSVFVRHFVGVSMNRELIREWQLEQTARGQFVFRYTPLKLAGLEENLRKLKESFHIAFGQSAVIEMTQVAEIPLTATGKKRWIINRVK